MPHERGDREKRALAGRSPFEPRIQRLLVALLTLLVGCDPAARLNANDPFAGARNRIQHLMARQKIASFQVAVGRDGKILYEEAFGFETVQHGGGGPGIHNWLYMIPSENLVIALMSNARYANTTPILSSWS